MKIMKKQQENYLNIIHRDIKPENLLLFQDIQNMNENNENDCG